MIENYSIDKFLNISNLLSSGKTLVFLSLEISQELLYQRYMKNHCVNKTIKEELMTKKEKQYIEDLEIKLALKWTDDVLPDIPIPTNKSINNKGFLYNNYSLIIDDACSSSTHHALNKKTLRKGGRQLFNTKLKAAQALRHDLETQYAKSLRKIDFMIEKYKKEECS